MEKQNNKGIIICMIFIMIIMLGIIGYLVWDKINDNSSDTPTEENQTNENYLRDNATLIKVENKEVTLNGTKHNLRIIYSYGYEKNVGDEQWANTIYATILLDNKIISLDLLNSIVYRDYYSDEDPSRYSIDTLNKLTDENINTILNNVNLNIGTIKDARGDEQYILLNKINYKNWQSIIFYYVIDGNGKFLGYDSQIMDYAVKDSNGNFIIGSESNSGSHDEFVKLYEDSFEMYHIKNNKVYKFINSVENGTFNSQKINFDDYTIIDMGL